MEDVFLPPENELLQYKIIIHDPLSSMSHTFITSIFFQYRRMNRYIRDTCKSSLQFDRTIEFGSVYSSFLLGKNCHVSTFSVFVGQKHLPCTTRRKSFRASRFENKGCGNTCGEAGFHLLEKMFEKTQTYSFSQTKNNRMLLANETNIVKLS